MNCCLKKFLLIPFAGLMVFFSTSVALAAEEAEAFSLPFLTQGTSETAQGSVLTISTTFGATTTGTGTEIATEDFCQKLEEAVAKLEKSYGERQQIISSNLDLQNKKIQEERQKYDGQRAWLRLRQDRSLEIYFARLSELAESDLQKKAIEQYKQDIILALTERRRLTDLAVDEYRLDMDNLKTSKITEVETRLIKYEEKLSEEIQKAAEICGAGNSLKAENSLQNRLLKLRQNREGIFKDVDEAGRMIIVERDRKVAEAESKYKKAVEQAKENLIKFFIAS